MEKIKSFKLKLTAALMSCLLLAVLASKVQAAGELAGELEEECVKKADKINQINAESGTQKLSHSCQLPVPQNVVGDSNRFDSDHPVPVSGEFQLPDGNSYISNSTFFLSKNGCELSVEKSKGLNPTRFGYFFFDLTQPDFPFSRIDLQKYSYGTIGPTHGGIEFVLAGQMNMEISFSDSKLRDDVFSKLSELHQKCVLLKSHQVEFADSKVQDEFSKKKFKEIHDRLEILANSRKLALQATQQTSAKLNYSHFKPYDLCPRYYGEEREDYADPRKGKFHVPYYSVQKRKEFRLDMSKLKKNQKSADSESLYKDGLYLFVASADGEIYLKSERNEGFAHSAFLGGGPVLAAGHIKIENGLITEVINDSGHYKPDSDSLSQFLAILALSGYTQIDKIKPIPLFGLTAKNKSIDPAKHRCDQIDLSYSKSIDQ